MIFTIKNAFLMIFTIIVKIIKNALKWLENALKMI